MPSETTKCAWCATGYPTEVRDGGVVHPLVTPLPPSAQEFVSCLHPPAAPSPEPDAPEPPIYEDDYWTARQMLDGPPDQYSPHAWASIARQLCRMVDRAAASPAPAETPAEVTHEDVVRALAAFNGWAEPIDPGPIITAHDTRCRALRRVLERDRAARTTTTPTREAPMDDNSSVTSGTIEESGRLPDGSGFAVVSFPLPADHWSTREGFNVPPMGLRLGTEHPRRAALAEHVRAAVRYAYRASTMNGRAPDLDPDALEMNVVVGLLGYWTPDGLSSDAWANPNPVPSSIDTAPELLERVAEAIYNALREKDEEGQRHPWVPGGNSMMQDEARRRARAALG